VLVVLAFFVLLLGIWPAPLLDVMNATIGQLVAHIAQSSCLRSDTEPDMNFEIPAFLPAVPEMFVLGMACLILVLDAVPVRFAPRHHLRPGAGDPGRGRGADPRLAGPSAS
jgi:hypothetical protein